MRLPKLTGSILSGLHCFLITAESMSFTRAAEILCLTQSAVSHKIKNLEDALSVSLFIRQPRRLQLTDAGLRLKTLLSVNFGEIAFELRELNNAELSGDLNVSVPPTFAQTWLLPRLSRFMALYPTLNLHIRTRNDLVDFQTEAFDCAVYFGDGDYGNLEKLELMKETLFPVCSLNYAKTHHLYANPNALSSCRLIHDAAPWAKAGHQDEWKVWAKEYHVTLSDRHCSFDRADLALQAAQQGLGVAMGRLSFVRALLEKGELVKPFDWVVESRFHYYLVYRSERKSSAKVVAFQEWLLSEIHRES